MNDQEKELLAATLTLLQVSVNQLEMKAIAVENALKVTDPAFYAEYQKALDTERTAPINALEPVINFIRLESKKWSGIPLSLTIEAWETRDKSAIPAM
ncbi:MAG: hypothetical protein WBE76_04945 [Terracidiphilus sp.]